MHSFKYLVKQGGTLFSKVSEAVMRRLRYEAWNKVELPINRIVIAEITFSIHDEIRDGTK